MERPQPTEEEKFEDVGLNDEAKQPPKKKSIFARFGDNSENPAATDHPRPSSSHRGFHLPGRKRGQSGQGAELGAISRPAPNGVTNAAANGTTNGANNRTADQVGNVTENANNSVESHVHN